MRVARFLSNVAAQLRCAERMGASQKRYYMAVLFVTSSLLFGDGSQAMADSSITNLWFPVGEELIYDIYWGVVPVGNTHVTTSWDEYNGKKVLAIRYVTKTQGMVNTVYKVDDFIESLVDPETFLPLRFTKRLKEGSYRCDEVTVFDHKKLKARWESKLTKKKKEFDIEKDTRDVVSIMYYLRAKSFQTNEVVTYKVMADEKLYDMQIHSAAKETAMKLDKYGKVSCIRLTPKAKFQGLFVRKGDITMWVSTDARRLCTRMMAVIPVANVRVTLAEVRGPGEDFWVKEPEPVSAKTGDAS